MLYNQLSLYSNDRLAGYKKKKKITPVAGGFVGSRAFSDRMWLGTCLQLPDRKGGEMTSCFFPRRILSSVYIKIYFIIDHSQIFLKHGIVPDFTIKFVTEGNSNFL